MQRRVPHDMILRPTGVVVCATLRAGLARPTGRVWRPASSVESDARAAIDVRAETGMAPSGSAQRRLVARPVVGPPWLTASADVAAGAGRRPRVLLPAR
jgi:hypothetical protein